MTLKPLYRRVLLKASGEALMGTQGYGIDAPTVERIASDIKDAVEDFLLGVALRSAAPFGGGHVQFQPCPFVVGEVGWVRCSRCHTLCSYLKSRTRDEVFKHPLSSTLALFEVGKHGLSWCNSTHRYVTR